MDLDWPVWPIFIVQLIIFLLALVRGHYRIFAVSLTKIIVILLCVVVLAIALSLYHDSTSILSLSF